MPAAEHQRRDRADDQRKRDPPGPKRWIRLRRDAAADEEQGVDDREQPGQQAVPEDRVSLHPQAEATHTSSVGMPASN
jgi:hypothetical protein